MPISRAKASARSKKAWRTRRTRAPGVYHNAWIRPSGEKVKLKGFTQSEVKRMKPAFVLADQHLKSDIKVNAKIKKGNAAWMNEVYKADTGSKGRDFGGYQYKNRLTRKSTIAVHPRTFRYGGNWDPAGLTSHELGHAVRRKDDRLRAPKRAQHRYQHYNDDEMFAETYRAMAGSLPLRSKSDPFFTAKVSPTQRAYMRKHYIR